MEETRIPTFVINLDSAQGRWSHMQKMLKSNGVSNVHRISAVNGVDINLEDPNLTYNPEKNARSYYAPLKKAEIACFLSHQKAWQKIVEDNLTVACILEDDVEFVEPPNDLFQRLLKLLIVDEPAAIRLYARKNISGKTVSFFSRYKIIKPRIAPLGMVGFLLNRHAAEAYLQHTSEIYEPVDVAIQRQWDIGFSSLVIQPRLVKEISKILGGTSLHNQEVISFSKKVRKELGRPVFRLFRYIKSYFV